MKVVETLQEFPTKITLRGLPLEAFTILRNVDKQKPVARVTLEGQNAAAVKRAFAAAAKALGGSVETRNAEGDAILVKWSQQPAVRGRRGAAGARGHVEHAEGAIQAEMQRLWAEKGQPGSPDQAGDTAKRKLRISAKRNLSRRANK
ncbi:MAG: hypothetical protein KGJ86_10540 [Chloroflexota bacterium]|nr:hypothetical protein [Chloroflexota bacterium]